MGCVSEDVKLRGRGSADLPDAKSTSPLAGIISVPSFSLILSPILARSRSHLHLVAQRTLSYIADTNQGSNICQNIRSRPSVGY
jgi:hypothetical protein